MLKKEITFEDFEGDTVTETHYFNMSRTELIEMELGFEGGLEKGLKRIIDSDDNMELFQIFKKLVVNSYGLRDGNTFLKNQELGQKFAGSLAFDELMVGFFTDSESAADFIRGMLPRELSREMPDVDTPDTALPSPPPPPAATT